MTSPDIALEAALEAALGILPSLGVWTEYKGVFRAMFDAGWNARGEADAMVCEAIRDKWVGGSDYAGRPMNIKIKATPADCATAIRGMK